MIFFVAVFLVNCTAFNLFGAHPTNSIATRPSSTASAQTFTSLAAATQKTLAAVTTSLSASNVTAKSTAVPTSPAKISSHRSLEITPAHLAEMSQVTFLNYCDKVTYLTDTQLLEAALKRLQTMSCSSYTPISTHLTNLLARQQRALSPCAGGTQSRSRTNSHDDLFSTSESQAPDAFMFE